VSEELEASNETTNGAEPEFGKTEKLATGGEFKSEQAVTRDRIRITKGTAASLLLENMTNTLSDDTSS